MTTPKCPKCGGEMFFIPGQLANIGWICGACPRPEPKLPEHMQGVASGWRVRFVDRNGERTLVPHVNLNSFGDADRHAEATVHDQRTGLVWFATGYCEEVAISQAVSGPQRAVLEITPPGKRTLRELQDLAHRYWGRRAV